MAKISEQEFKAWAQYIESLCGVHLQPGKGYLVETRLDDLLRKYKCSSFSELHFKAKADGSGELGREVIDRITTDETSFFRDSAPFDMLRNKILPDLIDRKNRRPGMGKPSIRIWSAACSNGQELYSIAMTLKDLLGSFNRFEVQLVGTDISDAAVAKASRGIYNSIEIQRGLPVSHQQRYFTQVPEGWKIADELRFLVTFRRLNLMQPFAGMGVFDVIFCRNVAIYFDEANKKSLFNRLGMQLDPDGYLIIGSTESITGLCPQFTAHRHVRSVYYQKSI